MYHYFKENPNPLRREISAHYRIPEREAVAKLWQTLSFSPEDERAIAERAEALVRKLRATKQKQHGVDALMHEFSLGCEEGIALMCLAEALLRIPDHATRYALIRDKLKDGNWQSHVKKDGSLFVNAASYGLSLSRRISCSLDDQTLSSALSRTFSRLSAPMMRLAMERAMKVLGEQFVTGQTMAEALENIVPREKLGYRFSFDMLGEAAMTEADAQGYLRDYIEAIEAVGRQSQGRDLYDSNGISVKLSAIHPRYERTQRGRVLEELYPRLKKLFALAKSHNIGLSIDAEEAARLELSLDLYEKLLTDPDLRDFDGIGFVVQAYSKRCPYVLDYLIDLARRENRRIMVRLVKGAYWDSEIKWAQTEGVPDFPVYTRKMHTDIAYLACAQKLLAAQDAVYPQFATHNVQTLATIEHLARGKTFEFQCLHGMGESLYDNITNKQRVRVYAPVGTHKTLLAYLVRRLLENGANSSFVHQLVDEKIPVEKLITPPWKLFDEYQGAPNPVIKRPGAIFPNRENSRGYNLSDECDLATLEKQLNAAHIENAEALTLADCALGEARTVVNPSVGTETVGTVRFNAPEDAEKIYAVAAQSPWRETPTEKRAAILRKAADLYQEQSGLLLRLAIEEAGKTLANAIAEVREAVDFLRYYADQIEWLQGQDKLAAPLGTALCISPWNFPLAIFTGQVAAALAAGNAVVAKSAEQTPLMAYAAVKILHQAGVAEDALQLALGEGDLGAALVACPFNAVLFTGSTEVAQSINQTLAQREDNPVLIAETGGMNAMVVDSSALAEQVVADVLNSAFDSAGQRCSALRVLLVQEEVADRIYTMLSEAMDELRLGDPRALNADIGPVIDAEAKEKLLRYQQALRLKAHRCRELETPEEGHFVGPSLYEIDSLDVLGNEVFGPVLHFLRYRPEQLGALLQTLNAKGYALTGGVHSRIRQTRDFVAEQLNCGNFYINRNIVGAVVGVQPFGGHGRSGTGPKAGGELYVQRLTQTTALQLSSPNGARTLPSITGEINTIRRKAGKVLLLGGEREAALAAVEKLRAAGFSVQVLPSHPLANEADIEASAALEGIQKAVFLSALALETRQMLAAQAWIVSCYDWRAHQDLSLLYREFSCSENVTAAGGNVTLMAKIDS